MISVYIGDIYRTFSKYFYKNSLDYYGLIKIILENLKVIIKTK